MKAKIALAILAIQSLIYAVPSYSQGPEWELEDSSISVDGVISENYINRSIYTKEYEQNLQRFEKAVVLKKGVTLDEFDALPEINQQFILKTTLSIEEIEQVFNLTLNQRYDESSPLLSIFRLSELSLPEAFSVGYAIQSIDDEYKVSEARYKSYEYLPNWSVLSASYDVGEDNHGAEIEGKWGRLSIEISQNNENGSRNILITKFISGGTLHDYEIAANEAEISIQHWPDGRLRLNLFSPLKFSVQCHSIDLKDLYLRCDTKTKIPTSKVKTLLSAIQDRDINLLMNDWFHFFKL